MKILTICSSPYISLEPVTQLLEAAGLLRGVNSVEKNQSYEQWHEQVFDAYEQDCSGILMNQSLSPGKVWQDMAGQLIQANLKYKQWYWTDSRTGWLLDFWLTLEPQHRFALIYSPPQLGISQCLFLVDEKNASIDKVIKNWINYHFELLRFYRRHQDKCILVNLQRCLAYPSEFIQICKQHLGLDVDDQLSLQNVYSFNESTGIEEMLLHLIVKQYPEVNNLFQELEASATPLVSQVDTQPAIQINVQEQLNTICRDYRNLKIQQVDDAEVTSELQLELKQCNQKNAEHEEENGLMLLQLSQVREEFEEFFLKTQKLESEQAEEKQALQVEIEQSIQSNAEHEKENEQMLLQLHQVQEELEILFLKEQKLAIEKTEEIAALEKQTQTLKDEVNQYKQTSTEYEKENRLMFLRVHQVQDELENYFKKYQELERHTQSNSLIACIDQKSDATSVIQAQFIQLKQGDEGFLVDLFNLQWQEHIWPKYHLQIIKPTIIDEQIVTPAAIKLPLQANNLLPLKTWPPQTADEFGAYWMIDESLLSIEQVNSHFYPEDIAFLHALGSQIQIWLKFLESTLRVKNNQWEEYYLVLEELQLSLEVLFKLQKS